MRFKYLNKIGFEMEGGWDRKLSVNIGHDGSVQVKAKKVGEVKTNPSGSLAMLTKYIDKNYPDKIDNSCGFHVHVSTKHPWVYSVLTHRSFNVEFLRWAKSFGDKYKIMKKSPFWSRLAGNNTFCKKTFNPRDQVKVSQKYDHEYSTSRYAQLNYCFKLHGTMENRLFPMFKNKELTKAALTEYVQFVEKWLKLNAEKVYRKNMPVME